ncbi:hypothetical protein KXQ82_10440 [Mucilaginibacter sp. HMF5004]|uniref:hypothetical protein n=1 Tax=Mucilaginibacter rivuli TaxID=2857527 RepID=UPI001C603DF1|nr:hypothetical protein [Mucilaginibacter rivuli]MBW4890137.1 hypothetical protein [Mucilaginibacter rivuli]
MQTGEITLMNAGFLILQLLLVSVYFSVKNKRWINITNELLGWGDILLLLSITCYFSILNYIFFYVFSLIAVVCIIIIRALINRRYEQIPLAGLQACILCVCLGVSWYYKINIANDEWIQ